MAFVNRAGYNPDMTRQEPYLPDANRIGLVTSTILLAFALARIIPSPQFNAELQLPGFLLALPLNTNTILGLLTACLAATGMDWLLRGHPALNRRATFQWWYLPTLTTFVISVPLAILPDGTVWFIGFALSAALVYLVLLAEYIVVDPNAPYFSVAMVGLTAISYTLFFILTVALRASGLRLYLILPALFIAAGLTALRLLHLRLSGQWEYAWALGMGLVCVQLAAGLYYWSLLPLQFGLFLLGPLYGLVTLAINLGESIPLRRAALEPVVVAVLCWGLAIFVR